LRLPTIDYLSPTVEQLEAGITFIRQQSQNGSVYVHCKVPPMCSCVARTAARERASDVAAIRPGEGAPARWRSRISSHFAGSHRPTGSAVRVVLISN